MEMLRSVGISAFPRAGTTASAALKKWKTICQISTTHTHTHAQARARTHREGGEGERCGVWEYLERSYPAERTDAREGKTAFEESFLTLSKGESFAILGEGSCTWSDAVVPLDAILLKVWEDGGIDLKRRERFRKNSERLKWKDEKLARVVPAIYLPFSNEFPPTGRKGSVIRAKRPRMLFYPLIYGFDVYWSNCISLYCWKFYFWYLNLIKKN